MEPTRQNGKETKVILKIRFSKDEAKLVKQRLKQTRLTYRQWVLQKLGLK